MSPLLLSGWEALSGRARFLYLLISSHPNLRKGGILREWPEGLARDLGSRPTITRNALDELKRAGLISIDGPLITVCAMADSENPEEREFMPFMRGRHNLVAIARNVPADEPCQIFSHEEQTQADHSPHATDMELEGGMQEPDAERYGKAGISRNAHANGCSRMFSRENRTQADHNSHATGTEVPGKNILIKNLNINSSSSSGDVFRAGEGSRDEVSANETGKPEETCQAGQEHETGSWQEGAAPNEGSGKEDLGIGESSSSSSSSSSSALFTAYMRDGRPMLFYNREGFSERISSRTVAEWEEIFMGKLDIDREMDGIRNWLLTHPAARPEAGREFMEAYIGNCLNAKLQRRGGGCARKPRKPWQPFRMPQTSMREMLAAMFRKTAAEEGTCAKMA